MNKLKQFGLALLLSTSIFVVGCGNGNAQELPRREQKVEQQTENKTEQQDGCLKKIHRILQSRMKMYLKKKLLWKIFHYRIFQLSLERTARCGN